MPGVKPSRMRSVRKKRVGYVRSKLSRKDGYVLRHLENKTYPRRAVIPRKGLAGNRKGLQVCISRAKQRGHMNGQELDERWERQQRSHQRRGPGRQLGRWPAAEHC